MQGKIKMSKLKPRLNIELFYNSPDTESGIGYTQCQKA